MGWKFQKILLVSEEITSLEYLKLKNFSYNIYLILTDTIYKKKLFLNKMSLPTFYCFIFLI